MENKNQQQQQPISVKKTQFGTFVNFDKPIMYVITEEDKIVMFLNIYNNVKKSLGTKFCSDNFKVFINDISLLLNLDHQITQEQKARFNLDPLYIKAKTILNDINVGDTIECYAIFYNEKYTTPQFNLKRY